MIASRKITGGDGKKLTISKRLVSKSFQ